MQRFWTTVFATGIPFGLCMWLVYLLLTAGSFGLSLMLALGSGALFGLCMAAFATSSRVQQSATPVFEANEQIITAGPANHVQGRVAIGGWLYLTNARLVFRAHSFGQAPHELVLALPSIAGVEPSMTAWVIPNGITVTTVEGQVERFVVEQRRQWVEALRDRLAHQ